MSEPVYLGVNFNNIRKALYLLFFGIDFKKDEHGEYVLDKDGNRKEAGK